MGVGQMRYTHYGGRGLLSLDALFPLWFQRATQAQTGRSLMHKISTGLQTSTKLSVLSASPRAGCLWSSCPAKRNPGHWDHMSPSWSFLTCRFLTSLCWALSRSTKNENGNKKLQSETLSVVAHTCNSNPKQKHQWFKASLCCTISKSTWATRSPCLKHG